MASHVDADNHKRVRCEINIDNNNDNSNQQHNDKRKRVWNNGVGMCTLSFESSNVEIWTSIANATSTKLRATTNDNEDDNDEANGREGGRQKRRRKMRQSNALNEDRYDFCLVIDTSKTSEAWLAHASMHDLSIHLQSPTAKNLAQRSCWNLWSSLHVAS